MTMMAAKAFLPFCVRGSAWLYQDVRAIEDSALNIERGR
jgi:hypothetical protein